MFVMMKTVLSNKAEINVGKWQTERWIGSDCLFVPMRARMRREYILRSYGVLIEETYSNTGKLLSVDEYTQPTLGLTHRDKLDDVSHTRVDILSNVFECVHEEFMSHAHGMDA